MTGDVLCSPWLGCIADDFTGASDLASFLVASGMRTVQINGVPDKNTPIDADVDAVVVALKSRTIAPEKAVSESLASLKKLQELGCRKFYYKYCSTFDSTDQGNIGPVCDALMKALGVNSTVICPALPINGRTVYKGRLFVFDQPLDESPMRAHPLTPMRDSSLMRLIEAQGKGKAANIPYDLVKLGKEAIAQRLHELKPTFNYIIIDALDETHLRNTAGALSEFPLITGGSGLALDLCQEFEPQGFQRTDAGAKVKGIHAPTLILSGSCSEMTQRQVEHYAKHHPSIQLDPFKLESGELDLLDLEHWLEERQYEAPMIYATATPDSVKHIQKSLGKEKVASLIESAFALLATKAKDLGYRNIIVAGGETSGAVVKGLKTNSFTIGESITPGVPIMQTTDKHPMNLALKSGNFGDEHFFSKALEQLTCI